MRTFLSVMCLVVLAALGLEAQSDTAVVFGVVKDPSGATIAGAKVCLPQVSAYLPNLIEQFPSGNADKLLAVNFAQGHAAGATLELSKYNFQKVGHGLRLRQRQLR